MTGYTNNTQTAFNILLSDLLRTHDRQRHTRTHKHTNKQMRLSVHVILTNALFVLNIGENDIVIIAKREYGRQDVDVRLFWGIIWM